MPLAAETVSAQQHPNGTIRMPYRICQWTPEIEERLAMHGVSVEEFEQVVRRPLHEIQSNSSGLPVAIGWVNGRRLYCVFRPIDNTDVEPVTAFEVED